MKKIFKILNLVVITIFILQTSLIAQVTYVIDYSSFTSNDCNVLRPNPMTTVPIVINGRTHLSTCGQPELNVSILPGNVNNNSIVLNAEYKVSNILYKATEYKIDFNFKKGYSYKIKVDALGKTPTNNFDPYCKLLLSFNTMAGATGIGKLCSGTEAYAANYPVNITNNIQLAIANFVEKEYTFDNLPNAQSSLHLSSNVTTTDNTSYFSFAQIRKITIIETAPPVTFTLTPATVSLQKGTSSSQTFTINNVNNSPGVTGYEWNLGPAPNGWLYAGTPAPQFITTTSNNLTLSSVACANTINSINVLAKIGTTQSYPTNTSTVSLSNPTYSITGPNLICNTSIQPYSLSPSNCAGVSWSVSNPIVTFTASGNTVNVSTNALTSGTFNLIATVPGVSSNVIITKPINVGAPSSVYGVNTTYNILKCIVRTYKHTVPIDGATNFKWFSRNVTQGTSFVQFKNGPQNFVSMGGDGSCDITEIKVERTNACNTASPEVLIFPSDLCPPFYDGSCASGRAVVASPNPAISSIQLSLVEEENVKPKNTQPLKIEAIKIVDKSGRVLKTITGNKLEKMNIDVSDLPVDVYTIMVTDGKIWISTPISKK